MDSSDQNIKLHIKDVPDENKNEVHEDTINIATLTNLRPKLQSCFGEYIAEKFIDKITNAIRDQSDETDWNNIRICLVEGQKSFHVVSGTGFPTWNLNAKDGVIDIVKSVRKEYLDEEETVNVINKRSLGRLIIKHVGNEGSDVDVRREGLRKLFQATIDYIQNHEFPDIWENATVTVYDSEDNTIKIKSGTGKNNFLVTEMKDKPIVKHIMNNKVKELKDQTLSKGMGKFSRLCSYIRSLRDSST